MSQTTSLFNKIVDEYNIYKAYQKSLLGKNRYKKEVLIFTQNETSNLKKLRNSLIDGTYEFGDYEEFYVYEPKVRLIHAPRYVDKIVQLSINNVLKGVYNHCFIYDSYACIDEKGTHKCVDRISYFMRKAMWEYGSDAHIVKIDIKKFFYTIDRSVLKKLYKKKIRCAKTLELIYKITDSASVISEKGLPLGNTLSQISANVYMNEVDQYAKRKLSIKYYVRYADDTVIIVKNKEEAKETLEKIRLFVKEHLNIDLNEKKSKIFPITQGVNTIGFKIHPTHRMLRNDSKKKIKRKMKKFPNLLESGEITSNKVEQIINSWHGHAKNANSYSFISKITHNNNYICKCASGALKVK